MSIRIKLNKKLFEAQDNVQQQQAPDVNTTIDSITKYLTNLFNTIKTQVGAQEMSKAMPILKTAKEQQLPYSNDVANLEKAVMDFSKIDTNNIQNVKQAADGFAAILSNIAMVVDSIQKSVNNQPQQNNQQNDQQATQQQAQPVQNTQPVQPAQQVQPNQQAPQTQAAQPAQSAQPTQPTQPAQPTQQAQ